MSESWGGRPASEEDQRRPRDEIDEPNGEQVDDLDDPATDEADVEAARDEAPADQPDEAPADEDLVAGEGPAAAAVARLDSLADLAPAEHVEVYEDVHRVLQDALADAAHDGGGDGRETGGSGEDRSGSP